MAIKCIIFRQKLQKRNSTSQYKTSSFQLVTDIRLHKNSLIISKTTGIQRVLSNMDEQQWYGHVFRKQNAINKPMYKHGVHTERVSHKHVSLVCYKTL